MGATLGTASTVFKTLKEGANAIREAKNLELYERMLAVYGDVMELVEQNRELVEENRLLKTRLKTQEELVHDGERYWIEKDGRRSGPYCATCWDIDSKLVRMRSYSQRSWSRIHLRLLLESSSETLASDGEGYLRYATLLNGLG